MKSITNSEIEAKKAYDKIYEYCMTKECCVDCIFSNFGTEVCFFTKGYHPMYWSKHLDV